MSRGSLNRNVDSNSAWILNELKKTTDKAAAYAIQRGTPMAISKKSTLIGSLVIEKNKKGFYNIIKPNKDILYGDISVFDVAIIIAQRYNSGEHLVIREILELEKRFSKFHTDMVYYLHCMKSAKKTDNQRLAILEDKFQLAEIHAKNIKDKLTLFKRVK